MPATHPIDDYVRVLDRRLTGPRRVKRDLLTEARDSMVDATEAYESAGLAPADAAVRAVTEFGAPGRIAVAYQMELAAHAGRRLAMLIGLLPVLGMLLGDRMWQGSPWSDATAVPASYLMVARALNVATVGLGVLAVAGLLGLRWQARTGADPTPLCRLFGLTVLAVLALETGLGAAIWVATVVLWPAALTWPPMLTGGVVLVVLFTILVTTAVRCLRTVGAVPDARRVSLVSSRPGTC